MIIKIINVRYVISFNEALPIVKTKKRVVFGVEAPALV